MRKTTEQTGEEQLALEFALEARADAASSTVLEQVRVGIGELGTGRAVEILDVQPSVLSESTGRQPRRQFQFRWFARLLLAFPPSRRLSVLRPLAELCGFDLMPRKRRTAEERVEELERALLRFGEPGRRALDEVPR